MRKLFATDVERIECVCSVSAMLKQVFFCLSKFFATFVLTKTIATTSNASRLNSENKVIIILSVEEWH